MQTSSVRKVLKNNGYEYIYIYYRANNNRLRINTKCKYVKGKMTKDLLYNSKMRNYDELNRVILKIQSQVNTYIRNSLKNSININDAYIEQSDFNRWQNEQKKWTWQKNKPKSFKTLLDYYSEFLISQQQKINIKKISLKNYNTLKNFLTDFVWYSHKQYYAFDINDLFIKRLIEFALVDLNELNKRNIKEGKAPHYKTKGKLQQDTLKKRLENLKEFCEWLNLNEVSKINIKKIFPPINKTTKDIIYLTETEINEITSIRDKLTSDYEKTVLNAFIFNLDCGLRYADLSNLSQNDFRKIKQGYVLNKQLNKESIRFKSVAKIPIVNSLQINIIEAYNFTFKLKSNQTFNKTLKKILNDYDLLNSYVTVKKDYIGSNTEYETILKRYTITCHTARRTLITNSLKQGYGIAQTMQMSGHKNIRTLQTYANLVNDELLELNLNKRMEQIKKQ